MLPCCFLDIPWFGVVTLSELFGCFPPEEKECVRLGLKVIGRLHTYQRAETPKCLQALRISV
jgi:hypothetical protein